MDTQPEFISGDSANPETEASGGGSRSRKTRQRSAYLFPAYAFATALDIARRVEESGGGALTEETLAVDLGLSVKSSGYRLKTLTARQFQLLNKQGGGLSTTATAKAILKPTSSLDAQNGYRQSFMAVPLFRAVAERFKGQFLPDSQSLRNVLEREFQVDRARVQQAEKVLLESARDMQLLTRNEDKTYLTVSGGAALPAPAADEPPPPPPQPAAPPEREPAAAAPNGYGYARPPQPAVAPYAGGEPVGGASNTMSFSLDEIAQLGDEDFDVVWNALGLLVRGRRGRGNGTAAAAANPPGADYYPAPAPAPASGSGGGG